MVKIYGLVGPEQNTMPVHGFRHTAEMSKTKMENVSFWHYNMIHETPPGHNNISGKERDIGTIIII